MRFGATVELPGGWLDDAGACHRQALVRSLCGRDEEWLYGLSPGTPLARVVTDLLVRCLGRLGPSRPGAEAVRQLPVGDRDYLLLKLRQLSFGNQVEMTLTCSREGCGARMDVDFGLDAIPVRQAPQRPSYRLRLTGREAGELRFRLPRGGDLEELAAAGGDDLEAALLGRCLLGGPASVRAVERSPRRRAAVAAALERRSPGVERELEATCPECRHVTVVDFDPVAGFFAEAFRRRPEFDRDVHLLSYHYHWPLGEILGMPRPRRRAYVALLRDQLETAAAAAVG
jgi:hypothetical protein